jgi:hypothetical protein
MAVCDHCKREMLTADSCVRIPIDIGGVEHEPVRYGREAPSWGAEEGRRCHDCGIAPGGYHHPGCDVECCPVCAGQLISCGCLNREEAEEED